MTVTGVVSVDGSLLELASMATERLEAEAATLAGHLAAATCRFLDVVAELDRREAWRGWEARSMAHWVSWKCGVGPRAAQEHVRVARAVAELPVTHAEFARGQLSFSKVRALTRFVVPDREEELVELARHTTANQLERIARAHGAACRAADPDRVRAALAVSGVSMRTNEDGTVTITARVPAEVAAKAMAAIDAAAAEAPFDRDREEPNERRVRGFEAVVDAFLEPDPDRPGVEVVVHVDEQSLAQDAPGRCEIDGRTISTEAARRIGCDAGVRPSVDRVRSTLDLGRRVRVPNPALRRAVLARDEGRCRFPGCTQRTRLRAHHVVHWARGGPTDRANLVMLCPTHHRSVHEGGWRVEADGRGGFGFVDPRGALVSEVVVPPPPSTADAIVETHRAAGPAITPQSIASLSEGERLDLDWTMTAIFSTHPPEPRRSLDDESVPPTTRAFRGTHQPTISTRAFRGTDQGTISTRSDPAAY